MVGQDRRTVSFMYSYPNLIPLGSAAVERIVNAVAPFEFEQIYGGWTGKNVLEAGRARRAVLRRPLPPGDRPTGPGLAMSDLLAARSQMAMSLAFHIIFAVVGIGMPVLMVVAERRWQKTGDRIYLELARRWAKGTAILFAVGAVSGTVLSFELGLLWPTFMEAAGPIIGMPFSLEGFAFFIEAIFLGVYLYGWNRISPRAHLWAGVLVAVSGAASGVFVVIANAWMNAPTGFELVDGRIAQVDPIAGMLNPMAFPQTLHMTLAAYAATGFAVAGIHAFLLLLDRDNAFHRRALSVALLVGAPARRAPADLGRLERQGRRPDAAGQARRDGGALRDRHAGPRCSSAAGPTWTRPRPATRCGFRAGSPSWRSASFDAEVRGLKEFPRDQWPHVPIVHTRLSDHGGAGHLPGAGLALGRLGGVAPARRWLTSAACSSPWRWRRRWGSSPSRRAGR